MQNLFKTKKALILFSAFVLVAFFGKMVFATPPTSSYTPGETLDPTCVPGDTNCDVEAPLTSTTGQAIDTDLTTIAGLTATTNNFIQSSGSAWASRTPTEVTATLDVLVGDSGAGGTAGLVPAPAAGDAAASKFLKADGTWVAVSSGLTVGTTTITSGSTGNILYNNAGTLGEMTTTGSGTVLALATSPVFTTPDLGTPSALVLTSATGLPASAILAGTFGTGAYTMDTSLTVPTILGGTATTSDLTLQTTSGVGETGADMHFLVGNDGATEAMTILNDGKVGIGTVEPGSNLTVSGANVSDSAQPGDSVLRGNFTVQSSDAMAIDKGGSIAFSGVKTGTTQQVFGGIAGRKENVTDANARGYLAFYTAGAGSYERMRIDSNGNVGIGTTDPDRLLHPEVSDAVTDAVTYGQRISHITSGTAAAGFGTGIEFELEGADATNLVAGAIETIWTDAGAGAEDADMVFKTSVAGAVATEKMRLQSDGALNITGLTASEILATDASKNLVSLAVATYPSLAELAYVKGVTSAIQTQIDTKAPTTSPTLVTPDIGVATATSIAIGANILDTNEWAFLDGLDQSIAIASTPQFARLGVGAAADATNILTITSASTTDLSKALNVAHTGDVTGGTGYGGYFDVSGASTTNTALYAIASGATTNYAAQFVGSVDIDSGAFLYDTTTGVTTIDNLNLGTLGFETDAGIVTWVDMPVTSATVDTVESYRAKIDGNTLLTLYSTADGSGGVTNLRVGIGTTDPDRLLHPEVSDAVTDAVTYGQRLSHITSGTAAAGFGTGIEFELEGADGTNLVAGAIETLWTDASTGAEDADMVFKTSVAGAVATEKMRLTAAGNLILGGGTTASEFRFLEPSASGTNYSAFKTVAQDADITYSLPPALLAGGVLTDVAGDGVLTWVATSASLSGLSAASATNTIANAAYAQVWNWDSLTTETALQIGSTSITTGKLLDLAINGTAAGASQTALNISLAGANATSGLTTYGAYISNTHTNVTSGTNVALYATASGATTANYAAQFVGSVDIDSGAFLYDTTTGETTIDNLNLGTLNFDTDAGIVTWVDMPVTSSATVNTVESYTAALDGNALLTVYSVSDGAGSIKNSGVGIGTSTPLLTLDVAGSGRFTGTATSELTGDIDPGNATTTVPGTGTLFTTELVVGDRITVTGETRTVTAIASDTSLTVDATFTSDIATDTAPDKLVAIFIARDSSDAVKMVVNDLGYVGIGKTAPAYALDVLATGTGVIARFNSDNATSCTLATDGTISCTSDISLKKNITSLDGVDFVLSETTVEPSLSVLDKFMSITPVTYNWQSELDTDSKHLGFIAQDVERVFPDIVVTNPVTGLKSLGYTNFIPYTVKAVQELNLKIDGFEARIAALENPKTLCVADDAGAKTCINKSQLDALLLNANANSSSPIPEAEPTPELTPEPEPESETITEEPEVIEEEPVEEIIEEEPEVETVPEEEEPALSEVEEVEETEVIEEEPEVETVPEEVPAPSEVEGEDGN